MVPFDRYIELWNRARPDKKLETRENPVPYAWAGISYAATLLDDDFLTLTGRLAIDIYDAGYVAIPLRLHDGVLARATLDGKPARLDGMTGGDESPEAVSGCCFMRGQGRHTLEVEVRVRLSRQGGWRVAEAVLPVAPACSLVDPCAAAGYGNSPRSGSSTVVIMKPQRPTRRSTASWLATASWPSSGGPRRPKPRLIAV